MQVVELIAAGDVSDVSDADKTAIASAIADAASVQPSAVAITITSASVKITATITYASAAARDAHRSSLEAALETAEKATALLAAAGIQVTSAPKIGGQVIVPRPAAYTDAADPTSDGTLQKWLLGYSALVDFFGPKVWPLTAALALILTPTPTLTQVLLPNVLCIRTPASLSQEAEAVPFRILRLSDDDQVRLN